MKKLLSILLTLCLLLTPVLAQAQGTETQLRLSDISLYLGADSDPIDLGFGLLLQTMTGENGVSLMAHVVDGEDQPMGSALLSLGEDGLTAYYNGMSNAYSLPMAMVQELVSELEDEMGMSLEQMLEEAASSSQKLEEGLTPSIENLMQVAGEVFAETELVAGEVETVPVLEEEYSLQRMDMTFTEAQCARVLEAAKQVLLDLKTMYPDEVELDLDDLEGLDTSMDVRLWSDEAMSVVRAEFDVKLAVEGENLMLPFALELVDNGEDYMGVDLSILMGEDGEAVFGLISFLNSTTDGVTTQELMITGLLGDLDNDYEQFVLYLSKDVDEENMVTYTALLNVVDGDEEGQLGASYAFYNSEDDSFYHDGYMDLWMTMKEDGVVQSDYEVDFLVSLVHSDTSTNGMVDLSGVPVLDLSQMNDEQMDEAAAELMTQLQSLLLGLMNDTGVQQLITQLSDGSLEM